MRVASLDPHLTAVLGRVADGPARPIVSFGVSHFSITYAQQGPAVTLWRREQTWCELATTAGQQRCLSLLFASPTTFSFGQRKVPLPLPELVFGSLLKKWNTFSPFKFSSDLLALFGERLVVSEVHNLNTQMLDFGRYKEKGFVGQVTYEALGPWSDEDVRALNILADFAFYAGVGYKTTMGMGLTRRVLNPSKARVEDRD
ncbi:MAG: CRISPR system precrRNA processing endoribonuclease RAMP protein Cas6 [Chloroflexota bacterium]